jgi:hypothetical protein
LLARLFDEGQTDYGGWQNLDNENTFDWNLAN